MRLKKSGLTKLDVSINAWFNKTGVESNGMIMKKLTNSLTYNLPVKQRRGCLSQTVWTTEQQKRDVAATVSRKPKNQCWNRSIFDTMFCHSGFHGDWTWFTGRFFLAESMSYIRWEVAAKNGRDLNGVETATIIIWHTQRCGRKRCNSRKNTKKSST